MKWYEMEERERIKHIYSRYTIKDFWEWWSDGEPKTMEVRIRDYTLIQQTANRFKLSKSSSGVYVNDADQLKNVIAFVRDKATVWFGIQPRKKNWNKWGTKSFGGMDVNVDEIGFLFIDIDRDKIEGIASENDLMNAEKMTDMILERLGQEGWNKSYIKLCSGHGIQLIIKLDFPIKMPNVDYNNTRKGYIFNEEYERMKKIIPEGIGKQILKYCNKFREELGVKLDKSCFTLSRVGALPVTKNYKYDTYRWRGIIELKNEKNTGLSDYILSKEEDIKIYNSKNLFQQKTSLTRKDRLRKGKLKENILIKFMMENNLPSGMRNNYLWFQLKCLIRDSNIDTQSKEFRDIHRELEQRHGLLTLNLPDKKFKFDENIINSYCIKNHIKPLYKLWPKRTKKLDMKIDSFQWKNKDIEDVYMELKEDNDIIQDMEHCKSQFKEGSYNNNEIYAKFIKGCINKYGEENTKYYFDTIFERYLSWE